MKDITNARHIIVRTAKEAHDFVDRIFEGNLCIPDRPEVLFIASDLHHKMDASKSGTSIFIAHMPGRFTHLTEIENGATITRDEQMSFQLIRPNPAAEKAR